MNQLVEQCKNQADPEEIKKLQEEKKQLVTQQKSATDEAQKLKVKVDAMRNEITRLQAEINVKKVSICNYLIKYVKLGKYCICCLSAVENN